MFRRATTAAALGLALTFTAQAADLSPEVVEPVAPPISASSWQFQATLYGWATAVEGEAGIGRLPNAEIDASFSDILDKLDGAFMGAFIARNGTLIFGADVIWSKLSEDVNLEGGTGPLAPLRQGAFVDFEQTLTVVTGFGGLRLPFGPPELEVYATAGARYQRLETSLHLEIPVVGFARDRKAEEEWIDPIVGLAVHYSINDKWFVNALADVGGFGVGADLDTQALVSVGYRWTPNVATSLGFRVLHTEFNRGEDREPGSFRYDATLYGPFAGLSLTF